MKTIKQFLIILAFSTVLADTYYKHHLSHYNPQHTFLGYQNSLASGEVLLPSNGANFGTSQASSQARSLTPEVNFLGTSRPSRFNICAICMAIGDRHCISKFCRGRNGFGPFQLQPATAVSGFDSVQPALGGAQRVSGFRILPPPQRGRANVCSSCVAANDQHCIRKYCNTALLGAFGAFFNNFPHGFPNDFSYNYYIYGPKRNKSY